MDRLNVVYYSEIGEDISIVCILDPSINGEEYIKNLNEKIEPYNRDIEEFEQKKLVLMNFYKYYASFNEITGSEYLNEREPKFPAEKPKGFKSIQEAYPEITAERERRKKLNLENHNLYYGRKRDIENKVEEELKPLKDELMLKWPEFKGWIIGSVDKIWYEFQLTSYKYLKKV